MKLLGRLPEAARADFLGAPGPVSRSPVAEAALAPAQTSTPVQLSADSFGLQRDFGAASLGDAFVGRRLPDGFEFPRLPRLPPIPLPSQFPKTTRQALAEMDTLLGGAPLSEDSQGGAEVTRDGLDANSDQDVEPLGDRYKAAMSQLEANSHIEQRKLEGLTPEQRDAYVQLRGQLMTIAPAGDPVAALALQKLLFSQKLTEGTSLRDGMTVLDGLSRLANGPVGEGLDRQKLLADLIQEVATPTTINQGDKGTCTATCVAIQLARKNPAEYVRLVAGLASPSGVAITASGDVLRPERDAVTAPGSRTQVQKLLAPALMELANPRLDYRNEEDAQFRGDKEDHGGLNSHEVDRVLESLYPGRFKRDQVGGFLSPSPKKIMGKIEDQLARGSDVLVGIWWGDDATHKVLVTGMENINGTDYVRYINPWGREERVTKDEFQSRLYDLNYEK